MSAPVPERPGTFGDIVILGALILGIPTVIVLIGMLLWWGGLYAISTCLLFTMLSYGAGRHFETVHGYLRERKIRKGGPQL